MFVFLISVNVFKLLSNFISTIMIVVPNYAAEELLKCTI